MKIIFFFNVFKTILIKNDEVFLYNFKISNILSLISFVKNSFLLNYNYLVDLFVCDYLFFIKRFRITYNLSSFNFKNNLFINYTIKLLTLCISTYKLFKSSIWLEREVYDMFGIIFFNNWDLRKILTDYTFFGFPLRKDFPLSGYMEIYYDVRKKSTTETLIELMQEFRFYIASNCIECWNQGLN